MMLIHKEFSFLTAYNELINADDLLVHKLIIQVQKHQLVRAFHLIK